MLSGGELLLSDLLEAASLSHGLALLLELAHLVGCDDIFVVHAVEEGLTAGNTIDVGIAHFLVLGK